MLAPARVHARLVARQWVVSKRTANRASARLEEDRMAPHRPPAPSARTACVVGATVLSVAAALSTVALTSSIAGASTRVAGHARSARATNASELLAASARSLALRPTYSVVGRLRDGKTSIAIDLQSAARGAMAQGVVTSSSKSIGFVGTIHFVALDHKLFLNADAPFWRQFLTPSTTLSSAAATAAIDAIRGRWIEIGGSAAASFSKGLGVFTDPRSFGASLFHGIGKVTEGRPTRVRGIPVIPVVSGTAGVIDIARTGSPLPIEISGRDGSASSGVLAFSYPARIVVAVPPHAESIEQLLHEKGS
jgi:hypothetical protein